jgi:hypothetical protein
MVLGFDGAMVASSYSVRLWPRAASATFAAKPARLSHLSEYGDPIALVSAAVACLMWAGSFRSAVDADPLALWSAPCGVHRALRVAHAVAPYALCAALDAVPYEPYAAPDGVRCVLRVVPHNVACPSEEWLSCRFEGFAC